jgi:hypothetical protein
MMLAAAMLAVLSTSPHSCLECHSAQTGHLQAPALAFARDVHARKGFRCSDCHGGDPTTVDPRRAMDPARGFVGKIPRLASPKLCARCHSDPALMHRYNPQQRVDQFAQYQTSSHGKRLAAGDAASATCVDCHSVHDIREVENPLAPVHPLRLPATCGRCHADAAYMQRYKIPATQLADYQRSVHWEALKARGDLSAPSCASCHGSHGASPPQVDSVPAVCGTCHPFMQELYDRSPHQPVFKALGLKGCVTCHGDHAIGRPSPEWLAGEKSVCARCHPAVSAGGQAAAEMAALINGLSAALERSSQVLDRARRAGMEVSEALLRQRDARQALLKSRVAVHHFRSDGVKREVAEGMRLAEETRQAGEAALREIRVRRTGLVFALAAILLAMSGWWLLLRSLERRPTTETPR